MTTPIVPVMPDNAVAQPPVDEHHVSAEPRTADAAIQQIIASAEASVPQRTRAAIASKKLSEIDPNNTTLEECNAALCAIYKTQCRLPAVRKPQLEQMADGTLRLMVVRDATAKTPQQMGDPFTIGRREGMFFGELMASIPADQRSLVDDIPHVSSLNAFASALRTVIDHNKWGYLPLPTAAQTFVSR